MIAQPHYIAIPKSGSGPGVVILHSWWGLNAFFKGLCDRLAEAGFVGLAPDLYNGQVASTLSGGALKTTIPGGKYAVLRYSGKSERVVDAWTALLRKWLPASGLQLDARPCFEYYPTDAKCDPQTGAFECEICIPVVPL